MPSTNKKEKKEKKPKKPKQKQKQKQIVKQKVHVNVQSSGGSGGTTMPSSLPSYIPQQFRDNRGENVRLENLISQLSNKVGEVAKKNVDEIRNLVIPNPILTPQPIQNNFSLMDQIKANMFYKQPEERGLDIAEDETNIDHYEKQEHPNPIEDLQEVPAFAVAEASVVQKRPVGRPKKQKEETGNLPIESFFKSK